MGPKTVTAGVEREGHPEADFFQIESLWGTKILITQYLQEHDLYAIETASFNFFFLIYVVDRRMLPDTKFLCSVWTIWVAETDIKSTKVTKKELKTIQKM